MTPPNGIYHASYSGTVGIGSLALILHDGQIDGANFLGNLVMGKYKVKGRKLHMQLSGKIERNPEIAMDLTTITGVTIPEQGLHWWVKCKAELSSDVNRFKMSGELFDGPVDVSSAVGEFQAKLELIRRLDL